MLKHALAIRFAAGKIDTTAGVIYGVSLATEGPARGHGVMCDATTLMQLKDCAEQYQGGLKVKMTHQGDAGDIVGYLNGFRVEGNKLKGNLNLLKSYERREYIMEIAATIPDNFGLSVAFSGPTEEVGGMPCARCTEIYSCDLVAEPAANPDGLFAKGQTVDASEKHITMTPDEILTKAKAEVATSLSEFGKQIAALQEAVKALAPSTELAAIKTQIAELSKSVNDAKTEFGTKLGDENKRIELAAKAAAQEFARHTGTSGRVTTDGAGNNAGAGGGEGDPVEKFVALAQKHFKASNSKVKAIQLAMAEDAKGYAAFRDSGKNIKWA